MRRVAFLLAGMAAIGMTAPVNAQDKRRHVDVAPYIEAGQVLSADLSDGDVLTYTTVTAGVDATVQTRRVQVQLNYNYSHRFGYDKRIDDGDVHNGVARVSVAVAPGFSLEAGGFATRAHTDIRGGASGSLAGNPGNVSDVYAVYAGPSFSRRFGPVSVGAGYRFGYTKSGSPSATGVDPSAPKLDTYDSATSHLATASVGVRPGAAGPVGVTVNGVWEQENAKQLDQRYNAKGVSADLVAPVTRTVALVGTVGYEDISATQRDPLLDGGGQPVTDGNGRYVTDPASPRRTAFANSGVYWYAGMIWRPDMRFELEAKIGRRYDTMSYTGSLSWQTSASSGLQVGVYDSIESFGRQLTGRLAALPTAPYLNTGDAFDDGYNGCIFADDTGTSGGCLNSVFQSISTANYRARGVDAIFSAARGPTRIGLGLGYANRRYYAPAFGTIFSVDGLTDQSFYGQLFAARALGRRAGISGDVFVNYYESGLPGVNGVWGVGANGTVYHRVGPFNASLSAGISTYDAAGSGTTASGTDDYRIQTQLGLGYRF